MPKNQPPVLTPHNAEMLDAIQTLLQGNEDAVQIPLTLVNQGIAQLVHENGKVLTRVGNVIAKRLDQSVTDNDNVSELTMTALLSGIGAQLDDNDLLLNHLASAAGMIQPGDPLTSALLEQVTDQPELAYSATLLIALRDAYPYLARIALALERIAGAQGAAPADSQEEEDQEEEEAQQEAAAPLTIEDAPLQDLG